MRIILTIKEVEDLLINAISLKYDSALDTMGKGDVHVSFYDAEGKSRPLNELQIVWKSDGWQIQYVEIWRHEEDEAADAE